MTVDRVPLALSGLADLGAIEEQSGRSPISVELRMPIQRMAAEKLSWGQERIASELFLNFAIRVSSQTVA